MNTRRALALAVACVIISVGGVALAWWQWLGGGLMTPGGQATTPGGRGTPTVDPTPPVLPDSVIDWDGLVYILAATAAALPAIVAVLIVFANTKRVPPNVDRVVNSALADVRRRREQSGVGRGE